jgi:very-short-patch-repair endonuclease
MNNYNKYMPKTEPTIQAIKLANELTLSGIKCELEKYDGYKHIDIAITSAFLNIEIDGSHHNLDREQAKRDIERTYYSYIKNFNTIRIPNSILKEDKDIKYTAQLIKGMIEKRPKLYTQKYCDEIRKENEKYKTEANANKYRGIIIGVISSVITVLILTIISIFIP